MRIPRSDSTRNKNAIMDATLACLNEKPRATIAEIAIAAGVARGTVYEYFATREELIGAVFERTISRTEAQLAALDLARAPWECLEDLARSSWRIFAQSTGFLEAAQYEVPAERVRALRDRPLLLLRPLLVSGRSKGVFRTDLTVGLQAACLYAILHVAGSEIRAGRLAENDASRVLRDTLHALLAPVEPLRVGGRS